MSKNCPNCKSSKVVLRGKRYNKSGIKQLYLCNSCEKVFVEPDGFERMRFSPKTISRAVHQHEDGFSLGKVKNHLWQHDNVKVSRWTIAKWDKKYSFFFRKDSSRAKAED